MDFYTRNECQGRILMPSIPGKTDRLVERLTALTTPREYEKEKVPDGLVDSLPPEGKNLHACSTETLWFLGYLMFVNVS